MSPKLNIRIGKVYIIKNSENNKVYIGKTFRDVQKRFIEHLNCKSNDKFHTFIKNSNKSIFTISILYQEESTDCDLTQIEMNFIKEYDSYYNGYNSSSGGEGISSELSLEVKQKMSRSHIGLVTGEQHPLAKLDWQQVTEIRENIYNLSQKELAKKYNVSRSNIGFILNNISWKISDQEFEKYKKSSDDILKNKENDLRSKLNWNQVIEIRENINNLSRKELAKIYNTSIKNIGIIIRNLSWKIS